MMIALKKQYIARKILIYIDLNTCVYFMYKIKINGNYIHMNINRREHENAGAY